jgi:hypothetical protein
MASAAPAIAAAVGAARRRVLERFRQAGAVSPAAAMAPYEPDRQLERNILARLRSEGVVCATAEGRVWLDEDGLAAHVARMRRPALKMVGGLSAAAAAAAIAVVLLSL